MCFVIFMGVGGFAVALWMHGHVLYAAAAGTVSAIFFLFFVKKMVKNAPCIFGKRRDC